jgi:MtfA peptidase
LLSLFKRRQRRRLRELPFPPEWRDIVQRRFSVFRRLDPRDQNELLAHAQVLLAEKKFEGCGGVDLTDEIKVVIAAQASLLLLRRDTEYYPGLDSILIYPDAYVVPPETALGAEFLAGDLSDELGIGEPLDRIGESTPGTVVLSWSDVLRGAGNRDHGCNVVLHEFAHQLDGENGEADGMPPIADEDLRRRWRDVFEREYERLCELADRGRRTFIDEYGSTHPSEFFAVATEHFFMEPIEFANRHPELYRTLAEYYRQDPRTWLRRLA